MTSPLMDPKNVEFKQLPVKEGYTEEEARLILQGKPLPPRISADEMVE